MPKILGVPKVRFVLTQRKHPETPAYIFLYFHYRLGRLKHAAGKIRPKDWDEKAQRAKEGPRFDPDASAINTYLDEMRRHVLAIWEENNRGGIGPDGFRAELGKRLGFLPTAPDANRPPSLFEFIARFIEEKQAQPRGTWKTYQTGCFLLQDYEKDRRVKLDYAAIDQRFFADFQTWLYKSKNHGITYASKVVALVKAFMREAQRRGYHSNTAYQFFTIKKVKTTKLTLTFDELEAMYRLELPARLERARDLFLIGAYTGLRFSDFSRIRPEHIERINGRAILTITAQKTGQEIAVPLLDIPAAILEKYAFSAPKISNQKLNDYLKEIGQAAGLTDTMRFVNTAGGVRRELVEEKWRHLTTHTARRSFATNFYKSGLIPIGELRQITGHATESMFLQYVGVSAKENAVKVAERMEQAAKQ